MSAQHPGQPLKLDKYGIKERILIALAKGATYRLACSYAGISYTTFRVYMNKGEALIDLYEEQIDAHPDKGYLDFYLKVKEVEALAALKWLEKIDKASEVQWQAAAWKLERRHPEEFGRYEKEKTDTTEDEMIKRAIEEVNRLQGEKNGRHNDSTG